MQRSVVVELWARRRHRSTFLGGCGRRWSGRRAGREGLDKSSRVRYGQDVNFSQHHVATVGEPEVRRFGGREFAVEELSLVREVIECCSGLSRAELAQTVCELLEWRRPNGGLKARECRDLLEQLEHEGYVDLPAKRAGRPTGAGTGIPVSGAGEPGVPVLGSVEELGPVLVEAVEDEGQRRLFRELVGRYHYLGYRTPFGAQLRYLVSVSAPRRRVVGAVQLSSPAWRLAVRDGWIGWSDEVRRRNLQQVVSNSRFLVLPWVQVRNLASHVLSLVTRRLRLDWAKRYRVEPLLVETLVDSARYRSTCYRAANWVELGSTTGRGRMDRGHERHGVAPKVVFVYPLVRHAARRLREAL